MGDTDVSAPRTPRPRTPRSQWNRKNPYAANVLANHRLSGPQSHKEVRHYEFDLGDSGLTYEAGDGIGVRPMNCPSLVTALIDRLGVPAGTPVTDKAGTRTLFDALTESYEISTPSPDLIDEIAQRTGDAELVHVLSTEDHTALDAWLWGKDVLDLLQIDETLTIDPAEFVALLRPLQHRVYSISSSPLAHSGTVHATVASVRYRHAERNRSGVCSTYLADRAGKGSTAGIFVSKNNSFRLPTDDSVPIVMIGPGTGIAPFRAFLHERRATGATGSNWLFFGDQRRAQDFLYEEELDELRRDGVLDRLDLAFSRDQSEKDYVQHRMRENGRDLYDWLQKGAHLYVCGDATRMAKDVDEALHDIVAEHGGITPDQAEDYLDALRREKRYLRDVY
ncbi:sulfite reductase subunit alpha [Antrihabitans sp. YC3-6]|uniref:assimilatory sulfite reductase (NADPH) n=1 Tax=Antrihabitans stalagmiti TaxID=2799499 RepID=A0A934U545_9NOCA|nr:sulfite reductase subunit alpha [Antrihabitans stalagmiti]